MGIIIAVCLSPLVAAVLLKLVIGAGWIISVLLPRSSATAGDPMNTIATIAAIPQPRHFRTADQDHIHRPVTPKRHPVGGQRVNGKGVIVQWV